MPVNTRIILSSMIWFALHGHAIAKDTNINQDSNRHLVIPKQTCLAPEHRCIPISKRDIDPNNAPITIVADQAKSKLNKKSYYDGDVILKQAHRTIKADRATLEEPENIITANGNVFYHDGEFSVTGNALLSNLTTDNTTLFDAKYKMLCTPGRGQAKEVFKNGTQFYELENGTYTTCPDKDNSWRFSAGKIEKEQDDIFADLYHARFEVLDIPIFYIPYLRIPAEEGRLTGFLYPSIGWNDSDGAELETPFYWNIHPQLDMLITPTYMSNRGLFTSMEPSYLTKAGSGTLSFEYMGRDELYPSINKSWGVNWRHAGITGHWKYNIDYSKVSDITYFNRHTDSRIGNREDNTLLQTSEMSFRDTNWNTKLSLRSFQALNENTFVYKLLPQLDFNLFQPDFAYGLDFSMPTQISQFGTEDPKKPDALRVNLEPTLSLPYNLPWLNAAAETRLFYTHFNQSNTDLIRGFNGEELEESVSRFVPMAKVGATVTLERTGAIFNNAYTQTLEPQLQYLYIKDVDQSNIYNPVNYAGGGYDTARLQTDYYGLFRANQYSSIDYINPANQFTLGAASRFFDDGYKERFNIAVGQIYYLNKQENQIETPINYSAWAIESELNFKDQIFLSGSLEYDSNISDLQFGNATLEYRKNSFFAQANYRYVSRKYIASTIGENNLDLITEDGISQFGFVTGFPITNKINFRGQYFHDLTQDLMLENQVGMTYTSSCWVIGFSYNEYLLARNNIHNIPKYDNNFTFTFSLLGLGANAGFGYSSDTGNALGYRNPFGLRN